MISLWLDGLLLEQEQQALLHHLRSCQACHRFWQELEQAKAILRSYPAIEPLPEFEQRLLGRWRDRKPSAPPVPAQWLSQPAVRLFSSAVGGMLIAVLTFLMLARLSPPAEAPAYWLRAWLDASVAQLLDFGREQQWQKDELPSSSQLPSRSYRS